MGGTLRILSAAILTSLLSPMGFASAVPSYCLDRNVDLPLRKHMVCMSYRMDEVYALIQDPQKRREIADHLQAVRGHLQISLGLTPSKLANMNPTQTRLALLDYQKTMAEALGLVARLESRMLVQTNAGDSAAIDLEIRELALRLQQVIGIGHQKFRN